MVKNSTYNGQMTKKDYILAAKIIRDSTRPNSNERTDLAAKFASFFSEDNPRFDRARWFEAIHDGTVRARAGTRPRPL